MTAKTFSRRETRSLIFHFLYALEAYDYSVSLESLVDEYNRGFDLSVPLDGEVVKTVQAVADKKAELDKMLVPLLANWKLERIGCCTRLILYLALWEMHFSDTPHTVVINEAIELAKCFSEKDAYKFINGILDEVLKSHSKKETSSEK